MAYRLIETTQDDEAWLDRLRRAVYQDLFIATWGSWDEDRHQRHFSECIARGEIRVIEYKGTRVGMIQLFEQADTVEVGEIQVEPNHQGRGIGTEVLRGVIARAHEQRKSVVLSTGLKNHRALSLYRRLGFKRVSQSETHEHLECKPNA